MILGAAAPLPDYFAHSTVRSPNPYVSGHARILEAVEATRREEEQMSEQNPLRDEIEQILLTHPRTRYAKVLIGMKQNSPTSKSPPMRRQRVSR